MTEFARRQRPPSRSHLSRSKASSPQQKPSLHSTIGNKAMQRLLQREAQSQEGYDVPFSQFQAAVVQAVNTLGGAITPDHVSGSSGGGMTRAILAVGLRSHRIMPTHEKRMSLMQAGAIKSGTLEGAGQIVYINLQSLPGRSRVTTKVVMVETSEIKAAGKSDFTPSPQGMTDAVMHALVQMGVPWVPSSEPYLGAPSATEK